MRRYAPFIDDATARAQVGYLGREPGTRRRLAAVERDDRDERPVHEVEDDAARERRESVSELRVAELHSEELRACLQKSMTKYGPVVKLPSASMKVARKSGTPTPWPIQPRSVRNE